MRLECDACSLQKTVFYKRRKDVINKNGKQNHGFLQLNKTFVLQFSHILHKSDSCVLQTTKTAHAL